MAPGYSAKPLKALPGFTALRRAASEIRVRSRPKCGDLPLFIPVRFPQVATNQMMVGRGGGDRIRIAAI
jgi:hypothetical protein